MRLALAFQAGLLRLAPRAFRARFGAELLDVTARALAEAEHAGGARAARRVALRHSTDLVRSLVRLHLESPTMRTVLWLLPLALLASAGIGWVDTHAEEVQPAALLLLVGTATLCFLDRRHAWLWWLVLGLSIPGAHLVMRALDSALPYEVGHFAETFLALLPAGAGALLGLGVRHWTRPGRKTVG